jgi:hypothetical protein
MRFFGFDFSNWYDGKDQTTTVSPVIKSLESSGKTALTEDEKRLAQLGYTQEVKRIFGGFTNFGLAASMISILLGIVPLYTYSIRSGGKFFIDSMA